MCRRVKIDEISYYSHNLGRGEEVGKAGTWGGGIFRSDDKGNSWTKFSKGLTNFDVNSLAVMNATLYAGTGDGVFRISVPK